jgi:hypothetical protein
VPCLAQAGKLTGEARYFDDAARQILQFGDRMFVKDKKLFMHAWNQQMDYHPAFHWARANGWAIMAMAELLDVLPEKHPARARVLALYRQHAEGLVANQGHAGLWHQLLDRRESYEETSASAMYVFALARGINRGWLNAAAFGPPVSLGWNAVAKKVNAKGQVEGVCVGTGVGWDPAFYMYRPVHLLAAHGYGPMFLAGAEMLELLRRPDIGLHDGGVQFGRALENLAADLLAISPRRCSSRAESCASCSTSFSAFFGLVVSLVPLHTSLFCGSENTKVSTVTTMSVCTSGFLSTHGSAQPTP